MLKLFRFQGLAVFTMLTILSFLAFSCGSGDQGNPNPEQAEVIATLQNTLAPPTPENSDTPTFTPSPTVTPTSTPTSTSTLTSTPSPTPEPIQIAADNLDRIRLVEEIGSPSQIGAIYEISVSPDGKHALILGETVMIYTFETGQQEFFEGGYYQAALSPDGSRLAVTRSDQRIEILPLNGERSQVLLQGDYAGTEVLVWAPDGARIAGYTLEAGLLIWDPSTGELLKKFSFPVADNLWIDQIYLEWSPDSQMVALVGVDQNVRVVTGDELITLSGFDRPVTHLDWSPDGTRLAGSSTHAPTVMVWRASNWNRILTISNHQYWVSNVAWSPDGEYLATADAAGTAFIRDPNNGSIIHYFPNQNSPDLVSWSPDGSYLLELFFNEFKIYDVSTQKSIEIPAAVLGVVEFTCWIPGSQRLLLSNADSRVQLWDIAAGEVEMLVNPEIGYIVALAWAPDGTRLALGEKGGGILLYDHTQGSLEKVANRTYPFLSALSWSPDGTALAVANNDQVAMIDIATGEEKFSFEDGSWRYAQDWSHPGDFVLTGNWKGQISLWDPENGKRIGKWDPIRAAIRAVDFSPDYERAVILANQSITLWDVPTGKLIETRQFNMDTFMAASQWAPDGSQIALVVIDYGSTPGPPLKALHYLDAETLQDTQVIELEIGPYTPLLSSDISWSPDGRFLALSSGEIRDGQSSAVLVTINAAGRVTWSPDGYSLIMINDILEIWQVKPAVP